MSDFPAEVAAVRARLAETRARRGPPPSNLYSRFYLMMDDFKRDWHHRNFIGARSRLVTLAAFCWLLADTLPVEKAATPEEAT